MNHSEYHVHFEPSVEVHHHVERQYCRNWASPVALESPAIGGNVHTNEP